MTSRPRVTVIIPTFNRRLPLRRALESVQRQSYRPIELIVVDDGSTDNSLDVISDFAVSTSNVPDFEVVAIAQPNRGVSAARNAGLQRATGAFVQFLDSDDALDDRKIATQVHILAENPELDVIASQVRFVYPGRSTRIVTSSYPIVRPENPSGEFLFTNDIAINSSLYRRRSVERIGGFNSALKYAEDVDFHLRLSIAGCRFATMPDVLASVWLHDGPRISNSTERTPTPLSVHQFYSGLIDFAARTGADNVRVRRLIRRRCLWLTSRELCTWNIAAARVQYDAARAAAIPPSALASQHWLIWPCLMLRGLMMRVETKLRSSVLRLAHFRQRYPEPPGHEARSR